MSLLWRCICQGGGGGGVEHICGLIVTFSIKVAGELDSALPPRSTLHLSGAGPVKMRHLCFHCFAASEVRLLVGAFVILWWWEWRHQPSECLSTCCAEHSRLTRLEGGSASLDKAASGLGHGQVLWSQVPNWEGSLQMQKEPQLPRWPGSLVSLRKLFWKP